MDNNYKGLANQMTSKNHLVRQLDSALDFSFIIDEVGEHFRPGITYMVSPEFIARHMLLIHLFYLDRPNNANIPIDENIDSQIQNNAAYRWFLKSELGEPIPGYGWVKQARLDFGGDKKWEEILDCLLRQCADKGLPYNKNGAWDNMDMWE